MNILFEFTALGLLFGALVWICKIDEARSKARFVEWNKVLQETEHRVYVDNDEPRKAALKLREVAFRNAQQDVARRERDNPPEGKIIPLFPNHTHHDTYEQRSACDYRSDAASFGNQS